MSDDRPTPTKAAEPVTAPSKADPETLVMRGSPVRPVRFRRNLIIAVSGATCLALGFTTWVALKPPPIRITGEELASDQPAARPNEQLAGAPASYDAVPELGPRLPGDLGRPILNHQRETGEVADHAVVEDPMAEERRKQEEAREAARSSAILMSVSGGTERPASQPDSKPVQPVAAAATEVQNVAPIGVLAGSSGTINPHAMRPPPSPWTVSAGTIIAASLITGLNSDLPGTVIAQVTENVLDSGSGRILLIPQGARLIGRYDNGLRFAQSRAFLVWQRIIWPDGSSIQLDDMPATDATGHAGISDRVDLHSGALLKGVALSTLLGVGTELSFGDEESEIVRAMREATQSGGNQAGQEIVRRSLDIQPTITVRPGWPVRVLVHRDLTLRPWSK